MNIVQQLPSTSGNKQSCIAVIIEEADKADDETGSAQTASEEEHLSCMYGVLLLGLVVSHVLCMFSQRFCEVRVLIYIITINIMLYT